ncbi:helix-turn-helix domain-containing protein [Leptospira sp. FAT2]|uniref:helix-turn-helix domain-containing protein n=1 Tax=Leptospira sanjuanensis TaxID=2879643 RepID=UPI001EE97338|nr:helix-turn-helix domain-containing protein [Leptospira sanjuanensis]MCG6195617.1 helix-turn-helix domain-containing protein [Leptospira sanjuanensis]
MKLFENLNTPGQRIHYIRTAGLDGMKKLNQEEFANSIFTSQANLSRIETDFAEPTEMMLFVIQTIYGFKMDWILTGKGPVKAIDYLDKNELIEKFEDYDKLIRKLEKDSKLKESIDLLIKLSTESREAVEKMIILLSKK